MHSLCGICFNANITVLWPELILMSTPVSETERIVRIFHESWDLRDPDRSASVIAEDCQFEDVARDELQPGPEAYKRDYYRWREAFPDGECPVHAPSLPGPRSFAIVVKKCACSTCRSFMAERD